MRPNYNLKELNDYYRALPRPDWNNEVERLA